MTTPDDDIDWNLKLGPELTQDEIAIILGVSRQRVSSLEARAMRKLREQAGSDADVSLYQWERTCDTRTGPRQRSRDCADNKRGRNARSAARDKSGRFSRGISATRADEQPSKG